MTEKNSPFTGWRRDRRVRTGVKVAEFASRNLIRAGGIGTILAVALICVFLVSVAVPLFVPGSAAKTSSFAADEDHGPVVRTGMDEELAMVWTLYGDGTTVLRRADTGDVLSKVDPFEGTPPTALSFAVSSDSVAFGYEDGSLGLGRIGFDTTFLDEVSVPPRLQALEEGDRAAYEGGMVQRTRAGQLRHMVLVVDPGRPLATEFGSAVDAVDHGSTSQGPVLVALSRNGALSHFRIRERKNMMTGEVTRKLTEARLPYEPGIIESAPPRWLRMSLLGDAVYLVWANGRLIRYDTLDPKKASLVEDVDLNEGRATQLTAVEFVLGKKTLLVGDAAGGLRGWFKTKPEGATTSDGAVLRRGHELVSSGPAVTALACGERGRDIVSGTMDGTLRVHNMTTEHEVVEVQSDQGAILGVALAPRGDAIVASVHDEGRQRYGLYALDMGHPEATLAALFGKVWYEGYEEPEHTWQSAGGTEESEPKLGLMPLVFGTLKATFYSLLFGVPVALLAAIFTSEFLSPRLRSPIKSTIEVMAGLPSVVLGFLAGLVIAQFVERTIPTILMSFVTVPWCVLLGAYLWQLLPPPLALRLSGWPRFTALALTIPLGVLLAAWLGPFAEATLFAGDIKQWLTGKVGNAWGGWMLLLLPLSSLFVAFAMGRWGRGYLRSISSAWSAGQCAGADLGRFLLGAVGAIGMAILLSVALQGMGLDPRGGFVDTYVQRNALVVGFAMGFAIIPIIYTLAEDALTSVPSHLREGSLGAGATRWQTATRIVVPTAMSGLFSACMIGLGRAVGETMIVLMAAGNTPLIDMNIFNGFRSLASNIATELPEAVIGDTHYRILFLTALVLFAMTFVVNTVAEAVRQRFRKRAYQL